VEWVVKARDEDGLDRARETSGGHRSIAKTMTHVGILTMPDRRLFRGSLALVGANVSDFGLRRALISQLSREDSSIVMLVSLVLLCVRFS